MLKNELTHIIFLFYLLKIVLIKDEKNKKKHIEKQQPLRLRVDLVTFC